MPPKTAEKSFPTVELKADRPEKMDSVGKPEKAEKADSRKRFEKVFFEFK